MRLDCSMQVGFVLSVLSTVDRILAW